MNFSGIETDSKFKESLSAAFNAGRFPHAVILEGGTQTARKNAAACIAQVLVCVADTKDKPCGRCGQCIKAEANSHSDIVYVEGSGSTRMLKVDDIRSLRKDAYIVPNEAEHKVYILLEAQKMNESAQNAFLKILEEPPGYACFILECEDKAQLLETVRSRCSVFRLGDTLDDTVNRNKQEKAKDIAVSMAKAMIDPSEDSLLCAVSGLEKNFDLLPPAVRQTMLIIRDAVVVSRQAGSLMSSCDDCAYALAQHFSAAQLLGALEALEEILKAADYNANQNLILTCLCYKVRRSLGR